MRAIASKAALGSCSWERSTKKTPSSKRSMRSAATCSPSLVFPAPPGPTMVTSLTPGESSIALMAVISLSRPKNSVVWMGRLLGRFPRVSKGGKADGRPSWTSW